MSFAVYVYRYIVLYIHVQSNRRYIREGVFIWALASPKLKHFVSKPVPLDMGLILSAFYRSSVGLERVLQFLLCCSVASMNEAAASCEPKANRTKLDNKCEKVWVSVGPLETKGEQTVLPFTTSDSAMIGSLQILITGTLKIELSPYRLSMRMTETATHNPQSTQTLHIQTDLLELCWTIGLFSRGLYKFRIVFSMEALFAGVSRVWCQFWDVFNVVGNCRRCVFFMLVVCCFVQCCGVSVFEQDFVESCG